MFKSHNICIRWSTLYWIEHDWLYLCVIELSDNVRKYFATSIGWKAWIQEERQKRFELNSTSTVWKQFVQAPITQTNKQTLWTSHLLYACILSLYSIWIRVVFILQDKIFCQEWNEALIWNGALTGAGTREIMFLRAALWQAWRGGSPIATLPHCQTATWLNIAVCPRGGN